MIHVDSYEDDQSLRRGSSQITVVDPYHPSLQRPATDPFAPASRRASAVGNDIYRPQSPPGSRKTSLEAYASSPPPRKPSAVVDPYQSLPMRSPSIRRSPTPLQHQDSVEQADDSVEIHQDVEKKVSFEEEEEIKPHKIKVTAQQRWHWAYNKIIMQINVSAFSCL